MRVSTVLYSEPHFNVEQMRTIRAVYTYATISDASDVRRTWGLVGDNWSSSWYDQLGRPRSVDIKSQQCLLGKSCSLVCLFCFVLFFFIQACMYNIETGCTIPIFWHRSDLPPPPPTCYLTKGKFTRRGVYNRNETRTWINSLQALCWKSPTRP